ncbi:MAG: translation initiation factor IF-2 N-terminal domain-containing protein, partial [Nitrospirota bacterium]
MRVFELAKQLGVPSKDLMKDLKGMGVSVSTHMAVLEDETVAKILAKSSAKTKKQPEAPPVKAAKTVKAKAAKPIQEKAEKEKGQASSLKPTAAAGRAASSAKPAPPVADAPKAEKKMVLVKRRPIEPSAMDDLAPLSPAEEAPANVPGVAELPKDAAPPTGPS